MKSEQGLLIQQKKIMDAAGIEPMTSRWKNSTYAIKARASFFHLAELATSEFWLPR